jgi:hypothetical protein
MSSKPSVVHSGRNPHRPVSHQTFDIGGNHLLVKYNKEDNEFHFRWNSKTSFSRFIHEHVNQNLPKEIHGPFFPATVLDMRGKLPPESYFNFLESCLVGQEREWDPIFEVDLRALELKNRDQSLFSHWNTCPDKELFSTQSSGNISMIAADIDKELLNIRNSKILSWYFDNFPPINNGDIDLKPEYFIEWV